MLTQKVTAMDWLIVLFVIGFTSITVSMVIKILSYFAEGLLKFV